MHVDLTEMSIFSCFSLKNKPIQSLHFMPNERFIFLVGSYLAKTDQWKCQVRIRYQVKALLIVEAFLLLNTVIFLCCCSHAWSLHYDKMGLGAGRGKRNISYLSGQLPHCLAVPPLFPSPSAVWSWNSALQKSLTDQRSARKSDRNPEVPCHTGHSTDHFKKGQDGDLRTKGWSFITEWRHYLMGGMSERSLCITCFLVSRKVMWEYAL